MDTSRSVPATLHTNSAKQIPLRISASVQSHMSVTSSQQRNRNHAHTKKDSLPSLRDVEANYSPAWTPEFSLCSLVIWLPPEARAILRRFILRRWLHWFLCFYVFTSVAFMLLSILRVLSPTSPMAAWISPVPFESTQPFLTSPLEDLPSSHLLSKLTAIYPQPLALIPNVLRADPLLDSVTACLWTTDAELDLLPGWMSRWPGEVSVENVPANFTLTPSAGVVSILVTTTATPTDPENIDKLFRKLSYFRQSVRSTSLSLHLMQIHPRTVDNPNTYLNLARLLSENSRVVLFPGNLSTVPPKALYRSYFLDGSSLAKNASHRPMLFTSRGRTNFPFSPLSPVILNRDDPLWCTERFFHSVSRESDWAECLWQVWLENFGDIDIKQTTDWVRGVTPAIDTTSMTARLRRRLSVKYRSETCMLATRQLAALSHPERRGADAKKTRWLKRNCREWMTLA